MLELELHGVEHQPRGRDRACLGMTLHVDGLAHQRMPGLAEMDPDLMRPPRLEPALDERRAGEPLERLHVRDGVLALARAAARRAADAVAAIGHEPALE